MKYLTRLCLIAPILALFLVIVMTASASAYLHVSYAQTYAKSHMWRTLCGNGAYCRDYPWSTGWYQRINSNEVRVEVKDYVWGKGYCARVFDVRGNDYAAYISTAGSSAYYYCN